MSEPNSRNRPTQGPTGKPSKLERIKKESRNLRGGIVEDLKAASPRVGEVSKQLLKFHGLYEYDDRDLRVERRRLKRNKAYSFMIRVRLPAGRMTAEQYLVHDDLATQYANGTLRITTRQALQLHGVLKGDLPATMRAINAALVTSLGACGDVVRNVMCCPLMATDPLRKAIESYAREISDHLLPRTRAYHELWVEGEKAFSGVEAARCDIEPIYGDTYLPRKLKIGVASVGDNCTDVYTQDIGLVALAQDDRLAGFNVLVGGGLGMTHNKPGTFPRLADPLAFVPADRAVELVEQIVRVQRDHGDRSDRRHARLKYLIHDRGLNWFRGEVERRLGRSLLPPLPMPSFEPRLHLGWTRQEGDRWCLGISVENGRILDGDGLHLKTGLRAVVAQFRPGVQLTPAQDILLTDLPSEAVAAVEATLRNHGVRSASELSNARLYSMACPALPTCGLALADAERILPGVIDDLERELDALGLAKEKIVVRMTGCPNGCARPYVADIGIVGRSMDRYVVSVGGRHDGTRLNQVYADLVPAEELVTTLKPLLLLFRDARRTGESFGDFCVRLGVPALRACVQAHESHAVQGE